jgi:ribosomal protein S18 acetylase RimI-like enzyme
MKKFKDYLLEKYIFTNDHVDSYSGQHNYELGIYDKNNNILGLLEYVVFEDTPSISMIQVVPKYQRKGIGSELVLHLQKLFPKTEIEWGYMTPEGTKLKKKLEKKLYHEKV